MICEHASAEELDCCVGSWCPECGALGTYYIRGDEHFLQWAAPAQHSRLEALERVAEAARLYAEPLTMHSELGAALRALEPKP